MRHHVCHCATIRQAMRVRGRASWLCTHAVSIRRATVQVIARMVSAGPSDGEPIGQPHSWYVCRVGRPSCAAMRTCDKLRATLGCRQAWHCGHMQWHGRGNSRRRRLGAVASANGRMHNGDVVEGGCRAVLSSQQTQRFRISDSAPPTRRIRRSPT